MLYTQIFVSTLFFVVQQSALRPGVQQEQLCECSFLYRLTYLLCYLRNKPLTFSEFPDTQKVICKYIYFFRFRLVSEFSSVGVIKTGRACFICEYFPPSCTITRSCFFDIWPHPKLFLSVSLSVSVT